MPAAEPDARQPLVQVLARPVRDAGVDRLGRSRTCACVTPPVDVITTTITSSGWSRSTSTCRTVVASSGGADTSASSRVARASFSVVACSARSISVRWCESSSVEASRLRLRVARARRPRRSGSRARSGTRPAEVCGCVSSPCASSSASSLRTVDAETPTSTSARPGSSIPPDAGGHVLLDDAAQDLLLARRRGGVVEAPFAGILAGQSSAVTPPPSKRPRGVSASAGAPPLRRAAPARADEPSESLLVNGRRHALRAGADRPGAGRA